MKNRRIGKIRLSKVLIEQNLDFVIELFYKCRFFVIDTNYNIGNNEIEYTILCNNFDIVELGSYLPFYSIIIENISSVVNVTVKKDDIF